MALFHQSTDQRNDYHYFTSDRSVTAQIGKSTNAGQYVWTVYHPDIKCAIWGGECESIESAKKEAEEWILQWVRPQET